MAKPAPESSIAIFGAGAVGLSAILAARLTSPAVLVLIDNSSAKLDMIPKELLEGVHCIDSSNLQPEEVAAKLRELSPDGRGMDIALDCAGHEAVLAAAHDGLAKCGVLVQVGGSEVAKAGFVLSKHLIKGVSYRGTHQGDSVPRIAIPDMIALWRKGKFPFDKMLSTFEFGELDKAMKEAHDGKVIKPVLVV